MEKKIVMVHIRLEEGVEQAIRRLAERDDRKLATYISRLLKRHAIEEGEYEELAPAKPAKPRK